MLESSGKSKYKRHGKEWGTKTNKNDQSMRARLKRSTTKQIDKALEHTDGLPDEWFGDEDDRDKVAILGED